MHKIHEKEFTLEDFSCENLINDGPLGDNKTKELEEAVKNCDDYYDACVKEDGYFCFDDDTGYLAFAVPFNDTSIRTFYYSPKSVLETFIIPILNANREAYLETKDKKYWWQMIQLLPSSYNQRRTVMLNYEVLAGIYRDRNAHKLDEWREFCQWIEQLPYSEIITCEGEKKLYKVGQYAEGYIEGTIELTEREAEIVERVINVKNWTMTHREDHSGIFSIEPCETEG